MKKIYIVVDCMRIPHAYAKKEDAVDLFNALIANVEESFNVISSIRYNSSDKKSYHFVAIDLESDITLDETTLYE